MKKRDKARDPQTPRQAELELDAIETIDAEKLLKQLAERGLVFDAEVGAIEDEFAEALRIVKRWLKKHWSDGWRAAGGAPGEQSSSAGTKVAARAASAPELEPAKARKAKR
jgi:hypothetical protein